MSGVGQILSQCYLITSSGHPKATTQIAVLGRGADTRTVLDSDQPSLPPYKDHPPHSSPHSLDLQRHPLSLSLSSFST